MGLGIPELDTEGRVITLEMDEFFLVCVYTPNSGGFLARLPFRKRWDAAFRRYVSDLDKQKPVIICGDFNAVHKEIDARNFEDYAGGACFTDQERGDFSRLLEAGFTDTFRYLYPDREHAYSWWSYMQRSRQRDEGWRIDCFLVSNRLVPRIAEATILKDVTGSDHCPIELFLRKS